MIFTIETFHKVSIFTSGHSQYDDWHYNDADPLPIAEYITKCGNVQLLLYQFPADICHALGLTFVIYGETLKQITIPGEYSDFCGE